MSGNSAESTQTGHANAALAHLLAGLSRRIAAAGWSPRPGMAVRDPDTGKRWRATDGAVWTCQADRPGTAWAAWPAHYPHGEHERTLLRGREVGPDPTDDMTGPGLLADLPEHAVVRMLESDGDGFMWALLAPDCTTFEDAYHTRLEAIMRAWLAAKETP